MPRVRRGDVVWVEPRLVAQVERDVAPGADLDPLAVALLEHTPAISAVDQLDLREIESDYAASLELRANDIQVSRRNPATDAQHHALFNRESVDSAGHARVD